VNITFAQTISVKHPCSGKTIVENQIDENDYGLNMGKITVNFLHENNINFQGSEAGISQILKTPIGDKSLVIIDDMTMLAFGWCYSINGVVPDKYADKVIYSSGVEQIIWFYGYSRNTSNKWVNMCKLASNLPEKYNPGCKKTVN